MYYYRVNSKTFAYLQQFAFKAENYLKIARIALIDSEIPDRKTIQKMTKAISILQFIAKNQPNWEL